MKTAFLLATTAVLSFSAAASRIVPEHPADFDPIDLRMTVDSCVFNPTTVRVTMAANVIRVTQQMNNCLVAGETRIADVRLGTFPVGSYRVELYPGTSTSATPLETIAFEVSGRPEIQIFPPPPRPITDYSGMWWNPGESGWGISLHQSATNQMFATLFVYGTDSQPDWYTMPGGTWNDSTTWAADIFHTTGPALGAIFNPSVVSPVRAGTATLNFTQTPGTEGTSRFSYTLNGITTTKTITRLRF
jgi:hypothetical protein